MISFCCVCQVKEVATKEDLSDELKFVKFSSISWTHDHKGFFYQVSRGKEKEKVWSDEFYVGSWPIELSFVGVCVALS